MNRMLLNSDDSELLVAFEQGKTVEKTAQLLSKDPSGVSRQLLRISRSCPALEKRNGRWVLTEMGRRLSLATKEFMSMQNQLAQQKSILRIGTNREFGSRVIGANILSLGALFPNTHLSISTFERGTEDALLSGQIDISFDCEKPVDPSIRFKHLFSDPIIVVSSPDFRKQNRNFINSGKLSDLPHLLCSRLSPHRISQEVEEVKVTFSFNDIATTRIACINDAGWALLPKYAVKKELEDQILVQLSKKPWMNTKYGVWWSSERYQDTNSIKKISAWAKSVLQ